MLHGKMLPVSEIAEIMAIPERYVTAKMDVLGLKPKEKEEPQPTEFATHQAIPEPIGTMPYTAELDGQVKELYESGVTYKEIGKKLNITFNSVAAAVKKLKSNGIITVERNIVNEYTSKEQPPKPVNVEVEESQPKMPILSIKAENQVTKAITESNNALNDLKADLIKQEQTVPKCIVDLVENELPIIEKDIAACEDVLRQGEEDLKLLKDTRDCYLEFIRNAGVKADETILQDEYKRSGY